MTKKLWIARDKDKSLAIYDSKPFKHKRVYDGGYVLEYYKTERFTQVITLPIDMFPNVTWENSPLEVELKIK